MGIRVPNRLSERGYSMDLGVRRPLPGFVGSCQPYVWNRRGHYRPKAAEERAGRAGGGTGPLAAVHWKPRHSCCSRCWTAWPRGWCVADEQGKFVIWNPAAEKILGMGAADLPSQKWTEHYGLFLPDAVTPFPGDQLPWFARHSRGGEHRPRCLCAIPRSRRVCGSRSARVH